MDMNYYIYTWSPPEGGGNGCDGGGRALRFESGGDSAFLLGADRGKAAKLFDRSLSKAGRRLDDLLGSSTVNWVRIPRVTRPAFTCSLRIAEYSAKLLFFWASVCLTYLAGSC